MSGEVKEPDEPREPAIRRREAAAHLVREAEQEAADDPLAALRRVRAALALDPACAAGHLLAGELLRRLGQLEEARTHFVEALTHQPSLLRARGQLEALDQAPAGDAAPRGAQWRREAWLLARRDLSAWMLFDLLAGLLLLLPPSLLFVLPVVLSLGAPADRALLLADLRAMATPLGLLGIAALLWLFVAGGCLLTGRLLVMARLVWWSVLDGRLAAVGPRLFARVWWQAALLVVMVTALAALLGLSLLGWPLLVFLAAALAFAGPLTLLGGRDAFAACSASYRATRGDWVAWLGLLLPSAAVPPLLAALALALPAWVVIRAAAQGGPALAAQVALALLLGGGLLLLAWLVAHAGAMVWMVALRERLGEDALELAIDELPGLLDPLEEQR